MAVNLYTGTPGSGKSYHVICQILTYLRYGKYVAANFPINFTNREIKKGYDKRFIFIKTDEITVDSIFKLGSFFDIYSKKKENQLLIVIDEASIVFNPREFKRGDRLDWINFLSQHRHYGFSFILITQVDRMIDRQIRGLIEIEYNHRKTNRVGLLCFMPLTVFCIVERWYQVGKSLGTDFLLYRKSIASHYSTFYDFRGMHFNFLGEEAQTAGGAFWGGPAV